MSEADVEKLHLPQMVTKNTDNHETAFTVSIDCAVVITALSKVSYNNIVVNIIFPPFCFYFTVHIDHVHNDCLPMLRIHLIFHLQRGDRNHY